MLRGRLGFDAVVLGDGSVLVVGDDGDCAEGGARPGSELAERYLPATDTWHPAEPLDKPRKGAAMVALPDGSAMIIGGVNSDGAPFSSTKIFLPGSGTWTDGPILTSGRERPVAATLHDGRVLVLGRVAEDSPHNATVELYDPSDRTWSLAAPVRRGWIAHAAVVLADGRALVTGTDVDSGTEPYPVAFVYDPALDGWVEVPSPASNHDALLEPLADGSALAAGGTDGGELFGGDGGTVATVDRFDPVTASWSPLPPMAATRLGGQIAGTTAGTVVVAGGRSFDSFEDSGDADGVLRSVERFDPATKRWSAMPDLLVPRWGGHALTLDDGRLLVLGGSRTQPRINDLPGCSEPELSVERILPD